MAKASFIVPHGANSRAYICIPLDECLAERSAVIQTLMELGGVSELPPDLDPTDVLTWAELSPERANSMSVEQLSFAMKVYAHKRCFG